MEKNIFNNEGRRYVLFSKLSSRVCQFEYVSSIRKYNSELTIHTTHYFHHLELGITEILYFYKRATNIIQEHLPILFSQLSSSIVPFSVLSSVAKSIYSELL